MIDSPRQKSGSSNDPKIDTFDVFKIRGDNNGTRLFEFLADNITKQTGVDKVMLKLDYRDIKD